MIMEKTDSLLNIFGKEGYTYLSGVGNTGRKSVINGDRLRIT